MEQLVRMAGRGRKVFVLLRVSSGSRFGMSRQEIRQCLDLRLDREQIEIQGVQFYPGTQRNDVRRTEQELRLLEQWLVFLRKIWICRSEKFSLEGESGSLLYV